jgi:hypothetical protein
MTFIITMELGLFAQLDGQILATVHPVEGKRIAP